MSPPADAARRTCPTQTILPYLNRPTNIKGCYAYLVDSLGVEAARDVIIKNPGVLQIDPKVIVSTSPEELVKVSGAARTVLSAGWPDARGCARGCAHKPFRSPCAQAANLVDTIENVPIPPIVRNNADKIIFLIGAYAVYQRLQACAGATCGSGGA